MAQEACRSEKGSLGDSQGLTYRPPAYSDLSKDGPSGGQGASNRLGRDLELCFYPFWPATLYPLEWALQEELHLGSPMGQETVA